MPQESSIAGYNVNKERVPVPPYLQIILIALSALTIGFFLYQRLFNTFLQQDIKPPVEIITPAKVYEFGGFQGVIKVGLYLNQFEKFDIIKNEFVFTGIVWFEFNPDLISLETLQKFSFSSGEILSQSPPDTILIDGKILARYNVRVRFSSTLNYSDFPVDDHRIYVTLVHQFVSPSDILFESGEREFVVVPILPGWDRINHSVETGYRTSEVDPYDARKTMYYPIALFSIDYSRYAARYVISILLPLLLIFYLLMFCFSLAAVSSVSLSTGGITGILAYKFVIDNLSPQTAGFMLSDYLFFLFLAASFLVFFINVIDIFSLQIPLFIKKVFIISVQIIVTSITAYFLGAHF